MRCPSCSSLRSKILDCKVNVHGQRRRVRLCAQCGTPYQTIEVDHHLFARAIDLVRARRDIDQQLLETLQWNTHRDTPRPSEKSPA